MPKYAIPSLSTVVLFLLFSALTFYSCKNKVKTRLENAIEYAGKNSPELEKVIAHYQQHSGDSLKLKAAEYLIVNMPGQKSYLNTDTRPFDRFSNTLDSLWKADSLTDENKDLKILEVYNSLHINKKAARLNKANDIEVINAAYLIENIDDAFDAWQTLPWSKNVLFEEFCESILPYKVFTEPMSPGWRKEIMAEFGWVKDSIRNKASLREATILINNALKRKMSYSSSMREIPRALNFHNLSIGRVGDCEHLVTYTAYVLKAMGIPALIDFVPAWGNNSSGHTWGAIKDENGKLFTYDAIYTDSKIEDLKATNVIPEGVLRNRKTPKVYRLTYGVQDQTLVQDSTKIPAELSDKHRKDVTHEYNFTMANLRLKLDTLPDVEQLYLCVYNTNQWKLCAAGRKDSLGYYQFGNLGNDIIYLPVIYKRSAIRPVSPPFLLIDSATIRYIIPRFDRRQELTIDRKSNIDYDLIVALRSTIGGVFQGSNDASFHPAQNLLTIRSMPSPKTNIFNFNASEPYRYFRYTKPSGRCRVAELKFYGILNGIGKKESLLNGKLFSGGAKINNGPEHIHDNDVLTYFVAGADSNGFVGLDLGQNRSARLTKIAFYPPNDGNTVEVGNEYELFYWDNDWKSLTKQTAQKEILTFHNCPTNALFKLRNLTKGYKERIFTYENGVQVWW